jgi:hypothetical protein
MLIRSKVLLCALSLCTLVSVHGEGLKNDNAAVMKSERKRQFARSFADRIGDRSPPYFKSRMPNIQQNEILSQTTDLAEAAGNPQNRDLGDGFDETAFWENYLLSGQVNSLPSKSPIYAPTYAPTDAPSKKPSYSPTASPTKGSTNAPIPPPTYTPAPPTEAPTCKPICKYKPCDTVITTNNKQSTKTHALTRFIDCLLLVRLFQLKSHVPHLALVHFVIW